MRKEIKDFQKMTMSSVLVNNLAVKQEVLQSFKQSMVDSVKGGCLYYHFYHSGHSNSRGNILISDENYGNQCTSYLSD